MDRKALSLLNQPKEDWNEAEDDMDQLYRRHAAWLGSRLKRRFGLKLAADTDDLVQETYLKLTPRASRGMDEPRALLMRIACNLANDLLRRRAVRSRHAEDVVARSPGAWACLDAADLLVVKELVLSLPQSYRDVFILSRFHGLTYDEIAKHCGLSVKSVEWRLQKAIAHCATRLQD